MSEYVGNAATKMLRMAGNRFYLGVALVVTMLAQGFLYSAMACPDIDGLVDVNCDGSLVILAFGDSITRGSGDSLGLGYPGRLQPLLPHAHIFNYGIPGENSYTGNRRSTGVFAELSYADYVIILEGINDYWFESRDARGTSNNLFAMLRRARTHGSAVLLGTLTPAYRENQIGWVLAVNGIIRPATSVDFFSLGRGILSGDVLHPNGDGYQRMAELVATSLVAYNQNHRPADTDLDGIYDFAEVKYGTDPANADSDGDGLLDGFEVFTSRSNPLLVDTDGDGFDDYYEVNTLRSNPSDVRPSSPQITSMKVLPR